MKTSLSKILLIAICLPLIGCEQFSDIEKIREKNKTTDHKRADNWFVNNKDKIDPYNNLSREDYMNIGQQRKVESIGKERKLQMPQLQDLLAEPESDELLDDRIVSISVNEDIPLKEVLVELARRAEVDVEIDRDISGSIIFIAKERPFSEVIRRISNIADLRYEFDDGVLRIKKDKPYIVGYKFNLLDITRNSSSSVNSSLSVGGSSGEGSTASTTSGSTSQLDIASGDGDIWRGVQEGVERIISNYKAETGGTGGTVGAAEDTTGATQGSESAILSVNKNAGMVSVLATKRQHEAVKQYLDSIHISLTSQVLIEAKILEVTLDDQFRSGIDWSLVTDGTDSGSFGIGSSLGATPLAIASDGGISFAGADGSVGSGFKFGVLPTSLFGSSTANISASVELLETFGVTRSLSNPRISTMNNQFAVLNFSQNEVYFQVTLERQEQDATDNSAPETTVSVDSEIRTVPIGIVLTLQPSIDLDREEITMSVRPTLTRITQRVQDPGVTIIAQDIGLDIEDLNSAIPVVEVRELDTVLRAGDGEIMVIGGLLEERTINTDTGVPGMSRLPFIGNAFKSVSKESSMVETVIFMKATIVPGQGVSIEDEEFYKKFNSNRRSFSVD